MDRRGFLGSLLAVTTAVASGVKLPAGREVARATPKALAVQSQLMKMLEECAVTSVSAQHDIDGPMIYEIEYVHFPGRSKPDETRRLIDGYTKNMRPVSVRFTESAGELARVTVQWM